MPEGQSRRKGRVSMASPSNTTWTVSCTECRGVGLPKRPLPCTGGHDLHLMWLQAPHLLFVGVLGECGMQYVLVQHLHDSQPSIIALGPNLPLRVAGWAPAWARGCMQITFMVSFVRIMGLAQHHEEWCHPFCPCCSHSSRNRCRTSFPAKQRAYGSQIRAEGPRSVSRALSPASARLRTVSSSSDKAQSPFAAGIRAATCLCTALAPVPRYG